MERRTECVAPQHYTLQQLVRVTVSDKLFPRGKDTWREGERKRGGPFPPRREVLVVTLVVDLPPSYHGVRQIKECRVGLGKLVCVLALALKVGLKSLSG